MAWFKRDEDTGTFWIWSGKNAFVHTCCDWHFSGYNWYTFDVIAIEFENDSILGAYEATFKLLGLGFRWRWNHTETEKAAEIRERIAEILKEDERQSELKARFDLES